MSSAESGQDPLIRLADELRDLGARLVGVAEALQVRSTATQVPAAPASVAQPPRVVPPPVAPQSVAPQSVVPQSVVPQPPVAPPSGAQWVTPPASQPRVSQPPPGPPPVFQRPMAPPPVLAGPPPGWQPMSPYAPAPLVGPPATDRSVAALWDKWGSRSLAWIGGAVTLLGVVLLLVLAVQRGWLGPVPRLLCGLAFAAGLITVGWRVRRTPSGLIGGFALVATGIAAVYLDVLAATALYHYLPVVVGLVAGLVVAVAGLLLAVRWDSPTLAIFVVLAAAACAPIITHGITWLLVAFLLVLAWATTPVHLRRRWRWLAVAADVPPLVASLVLDRLTVGQPSVTATAVVAVITVLTCLALAGLTVLRAEDDPLALGLLIASPTPVMVVAPLLTKPWAVACLGIVSVLLFAVWAVNLLPTRRLPVQFAGAAGAAGTVTVFQASAMATAGNVGVFTMIVLGEAVLLAAVAYRVRSIGSLIAASAFATVGLVTALIRPLPLDLLFYAPIGHLDTGLLRSALVVAALVMVAVVVGAAAVVRLEVGTPGIWWPLGFVGLYGFSGTVLCATMLVAPDQQGFLVGQVLVTVGWTGCALLLLVRGIEAVPARMAGLALVAGALVKLITFDLSTLDGIARVAAFLCSGLVLLAAGVWYAKLVTARRGAEPSVGE
jgi:uncharacterized membrane protein